jgi:acyl-CoA thioester hydrolase
VAETQLRVRYAETDRMGVVYHSHYAIWFEVGRAEAMRQFGCSYLQMEQDGCHLPVVELRCRYKAPAYYDDQITVRTYVKNLRPSMLHFCYQVRRTPDGMLLAEGETVHLALDNEGRRCSFPPKYLAALRAAVGK